MDIPDFLEHVTAHQISHTLAELAASSDPESVSTLAEILLYKHSDTLLKHDIPKLAAIALLHKGRMGVRKLVELLPLAPGYIYPQSILAALWYASKSKLVLDLGILNLVPPLSEPLPDDVIDEARFAVHEVVLESRINPGLFNILIGFLYQYNLVSLLQPEHKAFSVTEVFELFTAGTIKISRKLIAELEALINQMLPEEQYQSFLKEHPVFLDPLASEVIPKQKLGIELITDFVIRRYDNRYLLVEIEKPQDPLFTAANDFAANFTHAFGQIIDFQQWVDSHGEYARSLLPGISSPRGLLVIGRQDRLTPQNRQKLHRFVSNMVTVDVLTFDDIVLGACNLYANIYTA